MFSELQTLLEKVSVKNVIFLNHKKKYFEDVKASYKDLLLTFTHVNLGKKRSVDFLLNDGVRYAPESQEAEFMLSFILFCMIVEQTSGQTDFWTKL